MRMKHRRKLFVTSIAYLFLWVNIQMPQIALGAASGNYTDLLPIGAPSDTTVISRGSGWAITTLPPTQTFGDALSRVVTTVYQSTNTTTINATTVASTFTALGQGNVGSTTFPASWVASGRSIETVIEGSFSVPAAGSNWTWAVKLGTTTVLNTGAVASQTNQINQWFTARSIMTIGATGTSGTVFGSYEILVASGVTSGSGTILTYSTNTLTTVAVDLTSQLVVNPVFTWGTANSSMTIRNVTVKFLN